MIEPLDQLLAADALDQLTSRPIAELREFRVACTAAEGDVSLTRRIAQGRLDIVGHEVRRRAGDVTGEPDLEGLLFDLPDILADAPNPSGPSGRSVDVGEPGPLANELVGRLDGIASPALLAAVTEISDLDLRELFERMRSLEVELSSVRRQLHERIDAVQSEIGRRYRDGEASIESFLE